MRVFIPLPLSINSVAYWLLTSFNKIVINHVLTSEYNGYYAIGHKFGYALALVTTCFTFAWQDLAFSRKVDDESNGSYYSKACRLYMLFLGIGVILLLSAFNVLFPLFVDNAYSTAKATIPLFLITAMVSAYSTFVGNIFYAIKNTKIIFVSMAISCIVNLVLCYPLITLWKLNGANLSIIISFIINIIIRNIILKKKIGFSFDYKLFILVALGIAVSYVIYAFGTTMLNAVWLAVICIYFIWKFKKLLQSIFISIFRIRQ